VKKQAEAVEHIQEILRQREVSIKPGKLTLPDGQQWIVFECEGKQIGIDLASTLGDGQHCLAAGGWKSRLKGPLISRLTLQY